MKKEELQAKLEKLGKEYDKRWGVKRLEEELAKLEEPEEEKPVEKTLETIEKAVAEAKEEEKVEEERSEVLHTKEGAVMKATVKHDGVTYLAGEVVTLEPEVKKEFEEKGLV